ncbi:leucyl aminopeptidase [Agromyces intestinalis]|uniref:Probable cytosol aminopeptidase n=1 Tax=Agromyces intestinalis TaxID=2592652 RepID=A0A5C1YA29_9MICO|nr:leucyl aminopeptidase [Agromyces intestinalis]QEO13043.1 leucyl aminopeptidase [Agromyces intestinalis]
MSVPELLIQDSPPSESRADVVLLFAVAGDDGPSVLVDGGFEWVPGALRRLRAKGAADELVRLPGLDGAPVVAVAGAGSTATPDSVRLAAGAALRRLADIDEVAIGIATADPTVAAAALEGAALGAYRYNAYRSEPVHPVARIALHTPFGDDEIGLARVRAVAGAVARTKDLVNASPSDLSPEVLASIAVDQATALGIDARVLDEAALAEGGFGGILGVGQGSVRGPRLVRLDYSPEGATFRLALVGKGITFDSGGLSLKPAASMVGMKTDMAGAAAVLGAVTALAEVGAPIAVTAWLCLAENMPSGEAIRPNDVLRMKNGATVEVVNTDAEGRLVLADGLVAAGDEQPDAIVDVATLTGAQQVALGQRISGLMGDEALVEQVRAAAREVDEAVWPMPLPGDLKRLLKSDVADYTNSKLGQVVPGMLLAGVFLQEFVGHREGGDERIPWAHLDIAGPSNNTGPAWGFTDAGPTGVAVRTLIRLGESLAAK